MAVGETRSTCTPSIVVSFFFFFYSPFSFHQSRVMRSSLLLLLCRYRPCLPCVMAATKGASRLLYDVYLFVRFYNLLLSHSAIFPLSLSPAPIDPSLTPHSLFYRDEIDIHTHTWIRRDMRGHNEIWQSKRGKKRPKSFAHLQIQSAKIISNLLPHFQTSGFATTVDAI